jgi:hypothetical protein
MKKLTTLFLGAVMMVAAGTQTFVGVVTDTMCGADHKAMKISPDSKCVRECVRAGAKYALLVGREVYVLSDQRTPERFAAQKVKVTGTLDPKTKTIAVASIEPAVDTR